MKNLKIISTCFITTVLTLSFFIAPICAQELKIGYIDVSTVFDEYKKTVDADANLEKETQKKQEEREKKASKIKRMMDELDLLSEKGRQEKQAEIDEKVGSLKAFDTDTRRDLRKKRDDMVSDILKEIDYRMKEQEDIED